MYYREIAPRAELKASIKCFWILEDPLNTASAVERIVPDGRMELIFHYGSLFERIVDSKVTLQAAAVVTGQIREPLLIRPTGSMGMFGVRFYPFGFSSLFKVPSHELSCNVYDLNSVLGANGRELQERVIGAKSNEELAEEFNISARQLERLFQDKVGLSPNVFGRLVRFQSAVAAKLNDLTLSLTDLSQAAGYYDQYHFIKDFKDF